MANASQEERGVSTRVLPDTEAGIAEAAELLRSGKLVSFPTETVYGLGADARDGEAVARIFEAKGRPRFNPLIVHVSDLEMAEMYAEVTGEAARLAQAFWPGALTLVLPSRGEVSDLVTAGLETVAVRVPAHPIARALIEVSGGPVAAPSANPSGGVSPTMAAHVIDGLNGRIEAVLDGGPCPVGIESTIISLIGTPTLLRPGGVPVEAIEAALGHPLTRPGGDAPVTAPGMLASHYAPRARLRIDAERPEAGEVWIGFGPGPEGFTLSPSRDLREAAAALFARLREADARAGPDGRIAVARIPDRGLGLAINDRLRRAAAPR